MSQAASAKTAWERAQREFFCGCQETVVAWLTDANGLILYRRQCVRCGEATSVRKSELAQTEIQLARRFDEALHTRWCAGRMARYLELREVARQKEVAGWEASQQRERPGWLARPTAATTGPGWEGKRLLVLTRCKYLCEGCGLRPARVVHHLTYDHLGDEFLFELVGLCYECHDRVHGSD